MKSIQRWLKLKSRVRYWKRRALKAESKLDDALIQQAQDIKNLRDALDAEHWRNMSREDTFVSATVMGGRNMFGVPPRTGPAMKQAGSTSLVQHADAWGMLTPADKMEFDNIWMPQAEQAGISKHQAQADFMIEIAKRRAFNDEPFAN